MPGRTSQPSNARLPVDGPTSSWRTSTPGARFNAGESGRSSRAPSPSTLPRGTWTVVESGPPGRKRYRSYAYRSEERRVGKEGSSRGGREREREKGRREVDGGGGR